MWSGFGCIGISLMMTMAGCAATDQGGGESVRSMLAGKSEQEVSACAGEPRRRLEEDENVRLVYRSEPTVLERSFPSARGTVTCPHHGCEAHVIIQKGRTVELEYHPFPEVGGNCDHCDRIFFRCNP